MDYYTITILPDTIQSDIVQLNTVRLKQPALIAPSQHNKNRILFLDVGVFPKDTLRLLEENYPFIQCMEEGNGYALETGKPIQEFISLLRRLGLLE